MTRKMINSLSARIAINKKVEKDPCLKHKQNTTQQIGDEINKKSLQYATIMPKTSDILRSEEVKQQKHYASLRI